MMIVMMMDAVVKTSDTVWRVILMMMDIVIKNFWYSLTGYSNNDRHRD